MDRGRRAGDVGEFRLIEALMGGESGPDGGVVVGVGDDAAVLEPTGDLLVATCDSLLEGVHFELDQIGPRRLGAKAAQVNLSDIAAMGARPRWALVALTVPPDIEMEVLEETYAGLRRALAAAGASLVGGNTTRSTGGLAIEMTLLGEVARGRVLQRDGARPGDTVCVTGDLGGSGAGLAALSALKAGDVDGCFEEVIARHLEPRARLAAGVYLGRSGLATSCIDVSDGIVGDIGHICARSGVSVVIEAAALPVSAGTRAACERLGLDPTRVALTGGEDYELAFTVAPGDVEAIAEGLAAEAGVETSRIGTVCAGRGVVSVVDLEGASIDLDAASFDHLGGLE